MIPQNKNEPKTTLTQPELSSTVPSQGIHISQSNQHLSNAYHVPSPEKDTVVRETKKHKPCSSLSGSQLTSYFESNSSQYIHKRHRALHRAVVPLLFVHWVNALIDGTTVRQLCECQAHSKNHKMGWSSWKTFVPEVASCLPNIDASIFPCNRAPTLYRWQYAQIKHCISQPPV